MINVKDATFYFSLDDTVNELRFAMTSHYQVSKEELNSHPFMRILRNQDALTIYDAVYKYGREFLCGTSHWGSHHLEALKVLDLSDQPIERLCPTQYLVSRESPLGKQVVDNFSISVEDVKAGRYNIMANTNWFYDELATLLRTSGQTPSPPTYNSQPKRVIIPATTQSPPSHDPNKILGISFASSPDGSSYSPARSPIPVENMQEGVDVRGITTNTLIISFLWFLSNLVYPERNPTKPRPSFNMLPDYIKFSLFMTSLSSVNDGSGWKTRFSQSGRQWVPTGGAPLMTIEVQIVFLGSLMIGETKYTQAYAFRNPCTRSW